MTWQVFKDATEIVFKDSIFYNFIFARRYVCSEVEFLRGQPFGDDYPEFVRRIPQGGPRGFRTWRDVGADRSGSILQRNC